MNAQPQALHAVYSMSSMHRWRRCTASAEAIALLPQQEEGDAAKKGTAAHEELERILKGGEADHDHASAYGVALVVDYLRQLPPGELWIEERVRLTDDIWGRSDVTHWDAKTGTLTVLDLKDGFVDVDVVENDQCRGYGGASILTHRLPVKWVRYVIVQPNSIAPGPRVKQWFEPVESLRKFVEEIAAIPNGPKSFKAGPHCRYCPLFGRCEATTDLLLQLATLLQHTPDEIHPDQIAIISSLKKPIEDWFKGLDKVATKAAMAGSVPPGMKVVTATKHRTWLNDTWAREFVVNKFGVDALESPTPAQVEKLGATKEEIAGLVHTPEGSPVLAFANDRRPEFKPRTVASMFGAAVANLKQDTAL